MKTILYIITHLTNISIELLILAIIKIHPNLTRKKLLLKHSRENIKRKADIKNSNYSFYMKFSIYEKFYYLLIVAVEYSLYY
jgi:hypothetical protein